MTQQRPGIFTVVLTGGIASGKSTVADLFADLGVPIIDTDQISRELVEPGEPALDAIVQAFGERCLDVAGRLDRRWMRARIFDDPAARRCLESILHPLIGAEVGRRVSEVESSYCVVVIPLFAESSAYGWIDRVLVVDVEEETQIERVVKRDGVDRQLAVAILANQAGRRERLAIADDVLPNEGTVEELEVQVKGLHLRYLKLAEKKRQAYGQKD